MKRFRLTSFCVGAIRRPLRSLAAAILLASSVAHSTSVFADEHKVQVIYVIPSDREERAEYVDAITVAVANFQRWLADRLGGRSFKTINPIVTIVRRDRPAESFGRPRENAANAFYSDVAEDLLKLGAISFDNPARRYVVFVDADHRCGQSGATLRGVAIVSA